MLAMWCATVLLGAVPDWVQGRGFATSRTFVLPSASVAVEPGVRHRMELDGSGVQAFGTGVASRVGLGSGAELGASLATAQAGYAGALLLVEQSMRVRFAPWEWEIGYGHPAFSVEYQRLHSAPPRLGARVDVGGEMSTAWVPLRAAGGGQFWREVRGLAMVQGLSLAGGVAAEFAQGAIAAGFEASGEATHRASSRAHWTTLDVRLGPNLVWHPFARLTLTLWMPAGVHGDRDVDTEVFTGFFEPALLVTWHNAS